MWVSVGWQLWRVFLDPSLRAYGSAVTFSAQKVAAHKQKGPASIDSITTASMQLSEADKQALLASLARYEHISSFYTSLHHSRISEVMLKVYPRKHALTSDLVTASCSAHKPTSVGTSFYTRLFNRHLIILWHGNIGSILFTEKRWRDAFETSCIRSITAPYRPVSEGQVIGMQAKVPLGWELINCQRLCRTQLEIACRKTEGGSQTEGRSQTEATEPQGTDWPKESGQKACRSCQTSNKERTTRLLCLK